MLIDKALQQGLRPLPLAALTTVGRESFIGLPAKSSGRVTTGRPISDRAWTLYQRPRRAAVAAVMSLASAPWMSAQGRQNTAAPLSNNHLTPTRAFRGAC